MLHNALKIPVEEFTTPDPHFVSPQDKLQKIKQLITTNKYRHVLVVQENKAVGIISERDLLKALGNDNNLQKTANDIMSKDLYRITNTTNIDEVVFNMSDRKIGSAVIDDDQGNLIGIFTVTDALNALIEIVRGDF